MNATTLRRRDAPGSLFRRFPLGPWGDDFDNMLTRMFGEPTTDWFARFPQVDVSETEKEVEVRMDVPGFKPDQLDVQLTGDMLTVTGKQQEEKKEERDKTYHVVERRSGSFVRNVSLPCMVDANAIQAKFTDGVLAIQLPKAADAAGKKIKING
jgi:HSP20 family protein